MDINELKQLLKYHDNLYYNQDSPEISDAEYDTIKKRYLELAGIEEYDYVPGEASSDSIKYEHPVPVTSLDKVQITDTDKLKKELERLWPVIIQPKMDGLTLVSYPDGNHVTRGNGKIGEVVTSKINDNVKGIGDIGTLPIRSEVIMTKSAFKAINSKRISNGEEPFKNPRNAAAGMLRNKDISKVEGLKVFAYNLINDTEDNNVLVQMATLKDSGWNTVFSYVPKTIEEAISFMSTYNDEVRPELDYEIDGLVIKHNGNKVFGSTGHHPKNSIALKFEAEGEWTKLNSVIWNTGKTGIIAPVGEIEPIEILGSTISRVTLHNIGIINGLGLKIGANVKVIKANDVIPRIVDCEESVSFAINDIVAPSSCPCCGAPTELKNDILYCTGLNCDAQVAGKIELLASRDALDIEGLSGATIEKMIEYYYEHDLETVFELDFTLPLRMTLEDILALPGFAEKSAKKLYNNIQKAKDTDLKRFIYAANIPLIGRSASEAMANYIGTLGNLIFQADHDFEDISNIPDFGPKMINSLKQYGKNAFFKLWEAGVRPKHIETKPVKAVSEVLTFVITGSFDIPRKEIEQMIKDAGHKKSSAVSSKTSYLLASPGEESTSKYKKAVELGIPIVNSIEQLNELING